MWKEANIFLWTHYDAANDKEEAVDDIFLPLTLFPEYMTQHLLRLLHFFFFFDKSKRDRNEVFDNVISKCQHLFLSKIFGALWRILFH